MTRNTSQQKHGSESEYVWIRIRTYLDGNRNTSSITTHYDPLWSIRTTQTSSYQIKMFSIQSLSFRLPSFWFEIIVSSTFIPICNNHFDYIRYNLQESIQLPSFHRSYLNHSTLEPFSHRNINPLQLTPIHYDAFQCTTIVQNELELNINVGCNYENDFGMDAL